ncbi:MAG: ABC transporter substrate-binding protein [Janthinobacterium lividum]
MFRRLLFAVCLLLCLAPGICAAPPQRIVSLSPGTTEMLFALGLGRFVVGDTVYCNYPSAAKAITKVGDVNTSYEKVLSLRPNLIVADGVANARAVARLTALHQPVLAVTPTSLAAIETSLRQIGARTGTSKQAALVIAQMEHKVRLAAQITAADKRPHPRVLIVIQVNPLWTSGAGSFMDDLVTRAGGINIGKAVRGYGPFSKELVLAHPPDVILGDASSEAAFRSDPLLSRLPATRQGRFYSLPSDLTSRPGPRLADGLVLVAKALHGR